MQVERQSKVVECKTRKVGYTRKMHGSLKGIKSVADHEPGSDGVVNLLSIVMYQTTLRRK